MTAMPKPRPAGKLKTIGIHPKVWIPAIGQIVAGIALILFGLDVEGKTAIGTGLATFATGLAAPAAETEVR